MVTKKQVVDKKPPSVKRKRKTPAIKKKSQVDTKKEGRSSTEKKKKNPNVNKIYLSNINNGDPYYINDVHKATFDEMLSDLLSYSDFCFINSDNIQISSYYKELTIDVLKQKYKIPLLYFDPQQGPTLQDIINNEIADLTTEILSMPMEENKKLKKCLILDHEEKLSKSDLNLLYILKSDLKILNIGCVGLDPNENFQEALNALNLDRVIRFFQKITKGDIENYLNFAKEDKDGIIQKYLSNFEISTIFKSTEDSKNNDNNFIKKILSKFRE